MCIHVYIPSHRGVVPTCTLHGQKSLIAIQQTALVTGAGRFPEYDKTIQNMLLNKSSKVLCQGLTGKQVRFYV